MKLSLKAKIFLMVAIPFFVFLIVAGQMIRIKYVEYQKAKSVLDNLMTLDALSNFVHEAQKERGMTAGFLGGNGKGEELRKQRELSNEKADLFLKVADEIALSLAVNEITEVRTKVDKSQISTPEAIGVYESNESKTGVMI